MLTLEEIENISFRRAGLSGYKIEDVDSFVDSVIEKVRSLERVNQELETRIEQLNIQIRRHEAQADSVQDAIITAEITAKKLVRDATLKAQVILTDAQNKADNMVREAQEQVEDKMTDTDVRAEMILNNALSRSAGSIDENNRIIEQQKQYIKQIQSEVTRFREALIDSYKNHIKIINTLPRADEFRRYQEKLDESYPTSKPVTPQEVGQDIRQDAEKAVEAAKREKTQIKIEMINEQKVREISDEIRYNTKAINELQNEKLREAQKTAAEQAAVIKNARHDADAEEDDEEPDVEEKLDEEELDDIELDEEDIGADDEDSDEDDIDDEDDEDDEDDDRDEEADDDEDDSPDEKERKEDSSVDDAPKEDDEETQDVSFAEVEENPEENENTDSNADEIREAVREDHSVRQFREEPKPTSIDEIEDGVIFSSSDFAKNFEAAKNNRQPIMVKENKGKKKKKFGVLKLDEIE